MRAERAMPGMTIIVVELRQSEDREKVRIWEFENLCIWEFDEREAPEGRHTLGPSDRAGK
jgi:hypothetical protein